MAGKTCGYDPYENVVKVMEKAMDIYAEEIKGIFP